MPPSVTNMPRGQRWMCTRFWVRFEPPTATAPAKFSWLPSNSLSRICTFFPRRPEPSLGSVEKPAVPRNLQYLTVKPSTVTIRLAPDRKRRFSSTLLPPLLPAIQSSVTTRVDVTSVSVWPAGTPVFVSSTWLPWVTELVGPSSEPPGVLAPPQPADELTAASAHSITTESLFMMVAPLRGGVPFRPDAPGC